MVSLKDFIKAFDETIVSESLNKFSCPLNNDVEQFIKSKAVKFEKNHNARTYLIFNENDMSEGIIGYFSLAFKEVVLQPEVKNNRSKTKRLDGFNKKAEKVRVFLIGQLAKNYSVVNNSLNLPKILDLIYPIILTAQNSVGGRVLLLECENKPKLVSAYQECNFEILQKQDLLQMYRFVDKLIPEEIS